MTTTYRQHRDSCRKAAVVLRQLNELFGGTTDWALVADDLDEIADACERLMRDLDAKADAVLYNLER